ncbi:tripartite tricarboxylate transporter TctB family protein [Pseudarthrobacter raffinosi]|uniref:tripartite tricarboxylate transporter TctB family protein n=1 Tax=Pseudarthrobacter raffinosi TaxID=2953651 RepID=UPI00208F2A79|nr:MULTISPECIES: tripartite tricarboxylate transporter TctB family protein [unclassified Pseudarthrobacter]MCO4250353.1 tripartite tricarboxylate transporter TctB family protein [Pseudarthrobacter sp. MDT3-9]MCO4264779.1 tripartite tricarboxylate transporter TctB family protein [Pseudarthrobacter sp. MDT3-26]
MTKLALGPAELEYDRPPAGKNDRPGHQQRRLVPLVLVAAGVSAVIGSWRLSLGELNSPGPGLWPFIVSIAVTITAAILTLVPDSAVPETWTRRTAGIAGGVGSLCVFVVLFESIGFLIPAFLMLMLWLRAFGREPWRWTIPLAVGGAVVLHVIFAGLLGVPFPDDIVVTTLPRTIGF